MPCLRRDDQVKRPVIPAPLLKGSAVYHGRQSGNAAARQCGHRLIGLEGHDVETAARKLNGCFPSSRPGLEHSRGGIYEREQMLVQGGRVAGAPAVVQLRRLPEHACTCTFRRHGTKLAPSVQADPAKPSVPLKAPLPMQSGGFRKSHL